MNERQKAEQRLRDAADKYRDAVDAEQKACREWIDASKAMDAIGLAHTPQESDNAS